MLPALVVLVTGVWYWLKTRPLASGSLPASAPIHRRLGSPGPWGELEYIPIVIEPPDEFLFVSREAGLEPVWNFTHLSAQQVHDLIRVASPPPMAQDWLLDERNWRVSPAGVSMAPPPQVILALDSSSRAVIYNRLAAVGGNLLHELPLSYPADRRDEWFARSGLAPQTVKAAKGLLYPRGNVYCLSDWPVLLRQLDSQDERRRLLKVALRQTTLLARVRIQEDTDVEQLVAYWGRGGRAKDIRALLESMTAVEGGATLDIVHLLPRFVRARLYTYPFPTDTAVARRPNCFWTSLNFFSRETPDDRFSDTEQMKQALAEDYSPVQGDSLLGDVLLLSRPDGAPVHAAVHIADDLVLTKNGAYHTQPWMLCRMEDLLVRYPSSVPLKLQAYRRREL